MATARASARDAQPGTVLVVIHEFVARSADEINLSKGDRIELIERDDDFGDGWYLGRHLTNGSTGLFPEVYTTAAPKGTLTGKSAISKSSAASPQAAQAAQAAQQASKNLQSPSLVLPDAKTPTSTQSTPGTGTFPPSSFTNHAPAKNSPTAGVHPPNAPSRSSTQSSSIMNDTLGVIDEHITDMRKPHHYPAFQQRKYSGSIYDAQDSREALSYIQGSETEEEEASKMTPAEVKKWTPQRVAEQLEDIGVEKRHCEVFMEQEFTGEVVLGLDQSSIFLKELDLGPIGRRLKTWQKIRAFQEEVNGPRPSHTRKVSEHSTQQQRNRRTSSQGGTNNSSVDNLHAQSRGQGQQQAQPGSTLSMISSSAQHSPRPSAASIRSLGHSRRQSSIDQTNGNNHRTSNGSPQPSPKSHGNTLTVPHKKQSSFDRNWSMTQPAGTATRPQDGEPPRPRSSHMGSLSTDRAQFDPKRSSQLTINTDISTGAAEPDRGYVSEREAEGRTGSHRRLLRKKEKVEKPEHGRASSYDTAKRKSAAFFRRTSRASSPNPTDTKEISNPVASTLAAPGAGAVRSVSTRSSRVLSEPAPLNQIQLDGANAPTVTKLDNEKGQRSSKSTEVVKSPSSATRGLRVISDAVTGREKAIHSIAGNRQNGETKSGSPDSRSTPQSPISSSDAASKSLELDEVNKSKFSTPLQPPTPSARRKTKKETSAYIRGLEKKSPAEQRIGCDYSGWMKKKSSNLMTTWKPRIFVLRGCRLSYYYGEDDTEEKGLIDISGHRVLSAANERITGLHATLTRANTNSPASPQNISNATFTNSPVSMSTISPTTTTTTGESVASTPATSTISGSPQIPKDGSDSGLFIFKLVPPRLGMSKGVNFTKPTVHYFAVPTVAEGRLWMAAMMKATIDRDENAGMVTTYQQKTITLEQARARKERPPEFMTEVDVAQSKAGVDEEDSGEPAEEVEKTSGEEQENGLTPAEDTLATSPPPSNPAPGHKISGSQIEQISDNPAPQTPSSTGGVPSTGDSQEKKEEYDQMREVTDLEGTLNRASPTSPNAATAVHGKKSSWGTRRNRESTTGRALADGLGISGLLGLSGSQKVG